jgi:hypothetical protein
LLYDFLDGGSSAASFFSRIASSGGESAVCQNS